MSLDSSLPQESNLPLPAKAHHCVVLLRGVVWKSEEVQVMNLWQNLLRFWPVTFADSLVTPAGALKAHGGICAYLRGSLPSFLMSSVWIDASISG